MKTRIRFYLDSDRDAGLLAWLEQADNRSALIRRALYEAMSNSPTVEDDDIGAATLRQIIREELARVKIQTAPSDNGAEANEESDEEKDLIGSLVGAWDFDEEDEDG